MVNKEKAKKSLTANTSKTSEINNLCVESGLKSMSTKG